MGGYDGSTHGVSANLRVNCPEPVLCFRMQLTGSQDVSSKHCIADHAAENSSDVNLVDSACLSLSRGVRGEQQQDAQPAVRPEMACRCPRCGRINYKEGNNNNIKCPCKANFCYLCMELLIGRGASGRHFGPNRCKQHSE